ncbi:MAG: amidase [Chloroflexi bacterium]|nr:amidase [Chloroflexota bacterium]
MAAADLAYAGVGRIAALVRTREISAREVAEHFLHRIVTLGPQLNAIAAVMPDRGMAEAERADAAVARGDPLEPLHGVPYGAKDLLAARGAPTTWGAPPFRDQFFDTDATVIARLGRAGAPLLAKLAMVELAGGGGYRYAHASLQGPGITPWDRTRWSGGSSSGSGSAVAAGLVPFALGSETSGSILTPAAYCGVTGLRPTYGIVSRAGAMPLSWSLDKIGPMARSAHDCALVLDAIAGIDPADPTTVARRAARGTGRLRIGFAPADFDDLAATSARPALARALVVAQALDLEFHEVGIPSDLPYGDMVATIIGGDAASIFADLLASGRVKELVDARQRSGLLAGRRISAARYLDAQRLRGRVQSAFASIFQRVDLLLTPGPRRGAPPIDRPLFRPARGARTPADLPAGMPHNAAIVSAGNLAGLPAIGFPCGFDREKLPLGLQAIGPAFSESRLIDFAGRFQQATDWHTRRPPEFA